MRFSIGSNLKKQKIELRAIAGFPKLPKISTFDNFKELEFFTTLMHTPQKSITICQWSSVAYSCTILPL